MLHRLVRFFLAGLCSVALLTKADTEPVADRFTYPLIPYQVGCNGYWSDCNRPRHLGEDATATATTQVYAAANGIVKEARIANGYGGLLIIEHALPFGEKVVTLYGHLDFSSFRKREGDAVYIGEPIARVGTRSQNGGHPEHLHFAIHKGAYSSGSKCGEWIYAGYATCDDVRSDWHSPSQFVRKHSYAIRKIGSYGWYPPDTTCINAEMWFGLDSNDRPNASYSDVACDLIYYESGWRYRSILYDATTATCTQ